MWVHLKVNSATYSKDPYYINLSNLLLRKAWRYQRGQKSFFEERQTIQWPQDTKEVIRSRSPKKDRQCNGHKIRKGQSEVVLRIKTDNTMAKRKRTKEQTMSCIKLHRKRSIKQHDDHLYQRRWYRKVSSSCSTRGTRRVTLITTPVITG